MVRNGTLVIGGDGRYFSHEALQATARIAVGAGVRELWIGKDGLLSTPATSAIIRGRVGEDGARAFGAVILTASHNPAGADGDFGVKYNGANGAPAPAHVTDAIAAHTKTMTFTREASSLPPIDVTTLGPQLTEAPDGSRSIVARVIDPVEDYLKLLRTVFDFDALKAFFAARTDFTMAYDSMWAVQGPYAKRILMRELGLGKERLQLLHATSKEDFGGLHADPNLAHATELMALMGVDQDGMGIEAGDGAPRRPSFGAAADGDGDRNMILGDGVFVTPSDSLAVLAAHVGTAVPWFSKQGGVRAIARSMPTSRAADVVAAKLGVPLFEVPTGWKYFGNLMDTEQYTPLICGEESFGTSSDHVREKDGMWATLAWVSLLAARNAELGEGAALVGVGQVMQEHWREHGRHYYLRYDYEGLERGGAEAVMRELASMVDDAQLAGEATEGSSAFSPARSRRSRKAFAAHGLTLLPGKARRLVFAKSSNRLEAAKDCGQECVLDHRLGGVQLRRPCRRITRGEPRGPAGALRGRSGGGDAAAGGGRGVERAGGVPAVGHGGWRRDAPDVPGEVRGAGGGEGAGAGGAPEGGAGEAGWGGGGAGEDCQAHRRRGAHHHHLISPPLAAR